jgi:hypothetical protein
MQKFADTPVPTSYSSAFWTPIDIDEATQVLLYTSYFNRYVPSSKKATAFPDGVIEIENGEKNFLMLAVRLNITGKSSKNPIALAKEMRKWNTPITEPFSSYNPLNCYYKNPLLVQGDKMPRNHFQERAIGREGNVGEMSEMKLMPQQNYILETGELGGGNLDSYPNKKLYIEVPNPNMLIDRSPYEHAVRKEEIEQGPGPYDNTLCRIIEYAGMFAGKGNAGGKNTSYRGKAKSANPAQRVAKPRRVQRPPTNTKNINSNIPNPELPPLPPLGQTEKSKPITAPPSGLVIPKRADPPNTKQATPVAPTKDAPKTKETAPIAPTRIVEPTKDAPKTREERLQAINAEKHLLTPEQQDELKKLGGVKYSRETENTTKRTDLEAQIGALEKALQAKKTQNNNVNAVIAETKAKRKDYTSIYTLTEDEALEAGLLWVGKKHTRIDEGTYRSIVANADGTYNQYRMEKASLAGEHNPFVPHVHLEVIKIPIESHKTINGIVERPGKPKVISNNHIPIIKKNEK